MLLLIEIENCKLKNKTATWYPGKGKRDVTHIAIIHNSNGGLAFSEILPDFPR